MLNQPSPDLPPERSSPFSPHPTSWWIALGGAAVALLAFFLVILFLLDQMFTANTAANAPTPSPAPQPGLSQSRTPETPTPASAFVTFPTPTPVVTITLSRPRTSTPRSRPSATPTPVKYKVKTGDTLASIAKKYGVTTTDLIRVNGLKTNSLTPGQTLIIPRPAK